MKITIIFICFVLSAIVDGNMLAAAIRGGVEPVLLSFGTAFAALGQNFQPSHNVSHFDFEWNSFIGWLKGGKP